ncbi:hypothetical protein QWY86_17930 [Pedobacter aquatilis]|uniref:hypothetical protein n=1 Tax=Pedobacter aquatilis TaxID=351343 RepID=UPI0025B5248C|nr:hypothetical protein [Pedobacter aquatilis]MDN3588566.1 hypothetical protein [Pedobacter aquatilis]
MINQQFAVSTNEEYITIAEENDQTYWANRLGVSIVTLKSAIRACRSTVYNNVKAYLKTVGKTPN